MNINLDTVRMFANRLPFDSFSNMMIQWFKTKGWLDTTDLNFSIFTRLDEKAIDTATLAAARFGFAYFMFPRAATPVAIYNFSVGAYYISTGVVSAFRGVRTEEDQRKIAQDFHIGFIHALTAVYDYAIGRLMKTPILGLAGAALFAVLPSIVLKAHEQIFKKPDSEESSKKENETTQNELNFSQPRTYIKEGCELNKLACNFAAKFVPPLQSRNLGPITPQTVPSVESIP